MLGKIIGAAVGGSVAKQSKSIGGTTGAVIGAAVPFVLSSDEPAGNGRAGRWWLCRKEIFRQIEDAMPRPANNKNGTVASVPQPATA